MKHGFTRFGQLPRYAWLALFLMLLNCWLALPGRAQSQAVSGRVTTAKGEGLPGVNVVVKGATTGTVTNGAGQYSLGVPSNQVTVFTFSFVGFQSQDVTVGSQSVIDVTLLEDTEELAEVVVTALGIRKEARTLGYTTQEISEAQLVKARQPNPINGLTGKIAGLTVAPSAELLSRPQLILRGNADLLFVVDGVPINSDPWNVSPDDIETYTVLKGPNAAALYGFRGQNGAINRGWVPGASASSYYLKGINASLSFYGLTEGQAYPIGYLSGKALGTATVSISTLLGNADVMYKEDNAVGLEQIINQKYVAFHQNSGYGAFYNWRRTGFPRTFTSTGGGINASSKIPRRWQYPMDEQTYNPSNYKGAI